MVIIHKGKSYVRVSDAVADPSQFSHIPESVLQNKAEIGTGVHNLILEDVTGRFPIPSRPEEVGYFNSFLKWSEECQPLFHCMEERYFDDELMLTGQIDSIFTTAKMPERTLLDYKTSVKESSTWVKQAHLYYHLLKANGVDVQPYFVFLKLDKKGALPTLYGYIYDEQVMDESLELVRKFWKNFNG